MNWQQLENIFNRALSYSFSKQKWLFVFPILVLCGLIAVFFRSLSYGSREWVQMSLPFIPMFLNAGILLAMGLILNRVYYYEVKGLKVEYFKIIKGSKALFLEIPYLAIPLIFVYLILWIILGIFYLFKSIPFIGEFVGSILSFGPFLLILGSLFLGFLSILTLFYLTPAAAYQSNFHLSLIEQVYRDLKVNPFFSFVVPLLGLLPLLLITGFLALAAAMTQVFYLGAGSGVSMVLKWVLMLVPICGILTPAVIFFFNFSAESYVLMRKSIQQE